MTAALADIKVVPLEHSRNNGAAAGLGQERYSFVCHDHAQGEPGPNYQAPVICYLAMPPRENLAEDVDMPLPRHTLATDVGPRIQTAGLSRRRGRKRPRRALNQTSDDGDAVFEGRPPSDTEVAVMMLREQWPGRAVPELARTPPVVLQTQIYALVEDRHEVDRELDRMRAQNIVRFLRLPGRGENDRFAVVYTQDFVDYAASDFPSTPGSSGGTTDDTLNLFFTSVFPRCLQVGISQAELDDILGSDGDYTTQLIRAGYLTLRDESSLWFAVPGAGEFLKHRVAGRQEVVGALKRAPYKEMLLSKLEIRPLQKSLFPAQFHVRDIIGAGTAEAVATTAGVLVRLR